MKLTSLWGAALTLSLWSLGCASARPAESPLDAERYSRRPGIPGSALLYLPGHAERQVVQFQVVNGMAVRGGDVMLGPVTHLAWLYGMPRVPSAHGAVATSNTSHLWPRGEIPFEIDASVSQEARGYIASAINMINPTELEVRPRTPADTDFVFFSEGGGGYGCSSYMGRVGGGQEVQVRDCQSGAGVLHELMHAAGFDHEQCRGDRDNHVTIHWDEIPQEHHGAFEKLEGGQDIGPYDYGSIMHYPRTAFSRSGRPTIAPHVANAQIGQRQGLSSLDRAAISHLYRGGLPQIPGGPNLPPGLTVPGFPLPLPGGTPVPGLPAGLPPIPQFPAVPGLTPP